jgi:hypothetical protein
MPWRHMGSEGIAPPFLTSAQEGGEWSASRPCRFKPGKRAPDTPWMRRWVGLRAGLDAVKRKILHYRESNPDVPARSPSLYQLLLCQWTPPNQLRIQLSRVTAITDMKYLDLARPYGPRSLRNFCQFPLQKQLPAPATRRSDSKSWPPSKVPSVMGSNASFTRHRIGHFTAHHSGDAFHMRMFSRNSCRPCAVKAPNRSLTTFGFVTANRKKETIR